MQQSNINNWTSQIQLGVKKVTQFIQQAQQAQQAQQDQIPEKKDVLPENIDQFIVLAKEAKDKAEKLNSYGKNQKIVFLIGNTRIGKSTLFHLLRGNDLELNDKKKLDIKGNEKLIGHGGASFTSSFNVFEDKTKNIVIVDTPGLNDTRYGYQEVVSQINLQRALNKFKKVFFLIVVKYNPENNNDLQNTLEIAQQLLYNKKIHGEIFTNMRLVITQSNEESDMDDIFIEIQKQNPDYYAKEILEHCKKNSSQILFFRKNADQNEQEKLRQAIQQAFEQKEHQSPEQSDQVQNQQPGQNYLDQNYQFVISDKGKIKIQKFLSELIKFYEERLISVYDKINQELSESNEIHSNFTICQQIFNLHEQLYIDNVIQFQTDLFIIFQDDKFKNKFDKFIDETLNQAKILFTEGYVNQMLQIQEQNFHFQIKIDQAFDNFQKSACLVAQKLSNIYESQSHEWIQSFNSMLEVFEKLVTLKDWKKLFVIIGNRLSGKSKALNLLYHQKKFTENQLEAKIGIVKTQNYLDFASLQQINQDVVIEIKELQVELLPFLEIFFKTAIDRNSLFVIGLVLDGKEKAVDKVFQALNHFLESNQFDNLKIINNCQTQNPINQNRLIQLIPFLYKQQFDMQNCCCQILVNSKNYQIQNIQIFNDENLKQITNYNKKHQIIGWNWFFQDVNLQLIEIQKNVFNKDFCLWDHSKLLFIKNIIFLSQLNPDDCKDKFTIQLEAIYQKYDQKQLKYLVRITNCCMIYQKFQQKNQIWNKEYNLLLNIQRQSKIEYNNWLRILIDFQTKFIILFLWLKLKEFFPTLLNEKQEQNKNNNKINNKNKIKYKNKINKKNKLKNKNNIKNLNLFKELQMIFINLIRKKVLYYKSNHLEILLAQIWQRLLENKQMMYNNSLQFFVHQCLIKLQDLVKESKDPDFILNQEFYITRWPKKIYRGITIKIFESIELKQFNM